MHLDDSFPGQKLFNHIILSACFRRLIPKTSNLHLDFIFSTFCTSYALKVTQPNKTWANQGTFLNFLKSRLIIFIPATHQHAARPIKFKSRTQMIVIKVATGRPNGKACSQFGTNIPISTCPRARGRQWRVPRAGHGPRGGGLLGERKLEAVHRGRHREEDNLAEQESKAGGLGAP